MTGDPKERHWQVQIMGNPPQVRLTVWEDGRPATTPPLDEKDIGMLLGALGGAARVMERRTGEQEPQ